MTQRYTEEDEAMSPVLGPEYSASNRLAEAMFEKFSAEHLEPLVKTVSDAVRDKLWDDVRDWLLVDTEMNVAGAVRDMVDQTVQALLTGKKWAMERYPFADYSKGVDIRAAVAAHISDALAIRRIADLETELLKRDETIRWLREYR